MRAFTTRVILVTALFLASSAACMAGSGGGDGDSPNGGGGGGGGECPSGFTADCLGTCFPDQVFTDWQGDGYCDDGAYIPYDYGYTDAPPGVAIYLNCAEFDCDSGDCTGCDGGGGGNSGALLVPQQYATIQAAIDAASNGDVIHVSPGTYTGSGNSVIDLQGKMITVQGVGSPSDPMPVIDGEGLRRCVTCDSGENFLTQLISLEFRNGSAAFGGGAVCTGASPFFSTCVFTDNTATGSGGAMAISVDSSPVISNCMFRGNVAQNKGGAIWLLWGALSVSECDFEQNETIASDENGGAIFNDGGSLVIEQSSIKWSDSNALSQIGGDLAMTDCFVSVSPGVNTAYVKIEDTQEGACSFLRCNFELATDCGNTLLEVSNAALTECAFHEGWDCSEGKGLAGSSLQVKDCSFWTEWNVSATDSEFEGCSFKGGTAMGGVFGDVTFAAVTAENSTFRDCEFDCYYRGLVGRDILVEDCDIRCTSLGSDVVGNESYCKAGGAVIVSGDSTIRDSRFERCWSRFGGSALTVESDSTALLVQNCAFRDNVNMVEKECVDTDPEIHGGGAVKILGAAEFVGCTFQRNRSVYLDGYSDATDAEFVDLKGGAILCLGFDPVELTDCTFCGNEPDHVWWNSTVMDVTFAEACCDADLDHDGIVDGADLTILLGAWGWSSVQEYPGEYYYPHLEERLRNGAQYDFNDDGVIDGADLTVMLGSWGGCTTP